MTNHLKIYTTPIDQLIVVQRKPLVDARGYLERMYCKDELISLLDGKEIKQINHSMTKNIGVVRGMHFQYPPNAELKVISCLRGKVFDVAVDLRFGSPTFLKWHAEILSEVNYKSMVIPEGFAHGFQTLADNCELIYFHTAQYEPESEGGVNANDPRLDIHWPCPITEQSQRDLSHPYLSNKFEGIDT